jgi:hypothetical protein
MSNQHHKHRHHNHHHSSSYNDMATSGEDELNICDTCGSLPVHQSPSASTMIITIEFIIEPIVHGPAHPRRSVPWVV